MGMLSKGLVCALLGLALAPADASAQSYRCIGKDGKKYYGSSIPPQCTGQAIEQLNAQGTVVARIAARDTPEERARKEALAKQEAEAQSAYRQRVSRNRALLATYRSEEEIEVARTRALSENRSSTKAAEERIASLRVENDGFRKKLASYKGGATPPATLVESARNVEIDLKSHEDLLAAKKQEADAINGRYDDDLRRFRELRAMDAAERANALGMEKGVTVTTKGPSRLEQERNRAQARQIADRDKRELQRLEREKEYGRQMGTYR
jgi:hypothetical protein